jgi:hypothetical protein
VDPLLPVSVAQWARQAPRLEKGQQPVLIPELMKRIGLKLFSVRSAERLRRLDPRTVEMSKRQGSLRETLNKSGRQVSRRWLAFSRTLAASVLCDREVRWLEITNLKKLFASVQRIVPFAAIEISVRADSYECNKSLLLRRFIAVIAFQLLQQLTNAK